MKPCAPKGVRVGRGSKTPQIKAFSDNPQNLTLVPRSHMVDRDDQNPIGYPLTSATHAHPRTDKIFKNMVVGEWL